MSIAKKKVHIFDTFNYLFLACLLLVSVAPLINVLALSLSSSSSAAAGVVGLWPVDFSLKSYEYIMNRKAFWEAFFISIERILIGGAINVLLTIITSYPLSKSNKVFKYRTIYVWIFFFTMIFNGGLIPLYMLIRQLGMLDSIWALILPGAIPVFNIVLLLNFFRQIPVELEEAAIIDGAGQWRILFRIYVPCSIPAIATMVLLSIVGHWNSWFDGLIFMNHTYKYPLQSYLQSMIIQNGIHTPSASDAQLLSFISDKTLKCAQIFLGTLPILAVYPFLQRYFVKGIVLGGVKG